MSKAEDTRKIAAKMAELKQARGSINTHLWEKYLPGFDAGRRTGWSTSEVLAALDKAIKEPTA